MVQRTQPSDARHADTSGLRARAPSLERACLVAALAVTLVALSSGHGWAQTAQETSPAALEVDFPGVRVAHAEIRGRVFIAGETEGAEEAPAPNVLIRVMDERERTEIRRTRTKDNGDYTLPVLDLGRYRLLIGGLRVDLLVEERDEDRTDESPKVVIFVLPKELAEFER